MAKRKRVCYESPAEKNKRLRAKRARQAANEAVPAPRLRPRRHINRLPAEIMREILYHLLLQSCDKTGVTRYGYWWEPYRAPWPQLPTFTPVDETDEQIAVRHGIFRQRTRHYRNLWHRRHGVPIQFRNLFHSCRFARAVWEEHYKGIIIDVMAAIVRELGLAPNRRREIQKGVYINECHIRRFMGRRRNLDRNFHRLTILRGVSDMFFLQELLYNLFMTRRDRQGRPDPNDNSIWEYHPLNRKIPDTAHARILYYIFSAPPIEMEHHYDELDTWPQKPMVLRNYFDANPSAIRIWDENALSIVRDSMPVIRRGLEQAKKELDEVPREKISPGSQTRKVKRQNLRLWQRDWRYLEAWEQYLRPGQTKDEEAVEERENDEELTELLIDPRERSLTPDDEE
jgi:hypothetical protein